MHAFIFLPSSSSLTGEKGHVKKEFLTDETAHGEKPHEANSLHLNSIHETGFPRP